MRRLIGAGGAIRAAVARWLAARRGLAAVVAVFLAIVAAHLDAIPFWDGKNYLRCVETAVSAPFSLFNFRCFGHPSVVHLALWGVTQYVRPWSPAPIYAVNAIVGAASIGAFDALVRRLFPNQRDVEYTLVTALYALSPLFVAHAIFLNLDFGTTAFAVLFLCFLIAGRLWMAGAAGVALIFTKETGLAVWAVTVVAYLAAFVLQPGRSWAARAAVLRSHCPLLVVPLALGLYLVAAVVVRHESAGWVGSYAPVQAVPDAFDAMLNTNLADGSMRSFVADIQPRVPPAAIPVWRRGRGHPASTGPGAADGERDQQLSTRCRWTGLPADCESSARRSFVRRDRRRQPRGNRLASRTRRGSVPLHRVCERR
jgi:hypothetical protein